MGGLSYLTCSVCRVDPFRSRCRTMRVRSSPIFPTVRAARRAVVSTVCSEQTAILARISVSLSTWGETHCSRQLSTTRVHMSLAALSWRIASGLNFNSALIQPGLAITATVFGKRMAFPRKLACASLVQTQSLSILQPPASHAFRSSSRI